MEFTPVEKFVADEAVAEWRERNYDTELGNDDGCSVGAVVDKLNAILDTAKSGLQCSTDGNNFQMMSYSENLVENVGTTNFGPFIDVTLDVTFTRANESAGDEYRVAIERKSGAGKHLYGSQYRISCSDEGAARMLIEKSVDGVVAAARNDRAFFDKEAESRRFQDATRYDVTQLLGELAHLQELRQEQATDEA
jgi:hypothetical protein